MSNPHQIELGTIPDRFISSARSKINNSNCDEETKQLFLDISKEISNSLADICLTISKLHN